MQYFLHERGRHDNTIKVFVKEAYGVVRYRSLFPEEDDQAHAGPLQVLDHGVVMNDRQHFPFQRIIKALAYGIRQPLLERRYFEYVVVRLAVVRLERELAFQ